MAAPTGSRRRRGGRRPSARRTSASPSRPPTSRAPLSPSPPTPRWALQRADPLQWRPSSRLRVTDTTAPAPTRGAICGRCRTPDSPPTTPGTADSRTVLIVFQATEAPRVTIRRSGRGRRSSSARSAWSSTPPCCGPAATWTPPSSSCGRCPPKHPSTTCCTRTAPGSPRSKHANLNVLCRYSFRASTPRPVAACGPSATRPPPTPTRRDEPRCVRPQRRTKGKAWRLPTPCHSQLIAHRGPYGKTRVVLQNLRLEPEPGEIRDSRLAVRVLCRRVGLAGFEPPVGLAAAVAGTRRGAAVRNATLLNGGVHD